MEVHKALDQIAEIHRHLAKAEVYRGCRSFPVAITGATAVLGGLLTHWVIPNGSPMSFVIYWVSIASASVALVMMEVGHEYVCRATPTARRTTRKVLGQFTPCLAAGAIATFAMVALLPEAVGLLPGFWALLYSLGLFSARPYLPRAIGWVALFYLMAGAVLLGALPSDMGAASAKMASVFGPGQLLAALVLYWNLERKSDE